MRLSVILIAICSILSGCNNLPAEKPLEIPAELQPIHRCSHEIKHIAGHKILLFEYENLQGRQLFALNLGKVEASNGAESTAKVVNKQ